MGHLGIAAQLTLTLGRLLGEDMALERLGAFEATATGLFEALGSASVALHLRHRFLPITPAHCHGFSARIYHWQPAKADSSVLGRGPPQGSLLLFGDDHHDHLPPFELGELLNAPQLREVSFDPLEQLQAQLLMGHLAAPEA